MDALVDDLPGGVEAEAQPRVLEGKVRDGQTVVGDYDVKAGQMVFRTK